VGRFTEPTPLKYRSLELTGDDKRLQALAETTLFGPGWLTLELLGPFQRLPLVVERVGPAPAARTHRAPGLTRSCRAAEGACVVTCDNCCGCRAAYCTAFIMSKIGRYIAITMPPTITPRPTIIAGSMRLSSALTATSTSSS
jgi:hypothetical protein